MGLAEMRSSLDEKRGSRNQIQKDIKAYNESIEKNKKELLVSQKAQAIIQIVAQETQEQLEFQLNELTSLAMTAIFKEDAYRLNMSFNIKGGRTEAEPFFEKDGKKRRPKYGSGFGLADTASFFLRPTLYSLEEKKKRPVFLYDEPFRHLNSPMGELHRRAAETIKEMSEKLDIQIVIITQNADLINELI